jgi:hypothetical protein
MFHAQQEQIKIKINVKFKNTSGGVLENSFKLESFIKADVKSSTVIPPIVF